MLIRFFRRVTVHRRILLARLVLVLLLASSVPLAVANHYFLVDQLQHVSEVVAETNRLLLQASARLLSSRVNLMRYASDYTPSPNEALDDVERAGELLYEARNLIPTTEQKEAVTAVIDSLSEYSRIIDDVYTLRTEASDQSTAQLLFEAYRLGNDVEQRIEAIVGDSEAKVTEANESTYRDAQTRMIIQIGAYGMVLVLVVTLSVFFERSITRPVEELRGMAEEFRQGHLDARIPVVGSDELSTLAQEFNQMASSLQSSRERQEAWSQELEERVAERTKELQQAFEEQDILIRTIREMSVPVIPMMEGILVAPIVGTLDTDRAQMVTKDILAGIEAHAARVIILDITALAVMDTAVANTLLQAAQAAQLLGTRAILVGIAPEVAETLVQLGIDLHDLLTAATLQQGLHLALGLLRRQVISTEVD
jgi:anti-anti-sigma regulatory factor/HAMP domain-containing protein